MNRNPLSKASVPPLPAAVLAAALAAAVLTGCGAAADDGGAPAPETSPSPTTASRAATPAEPAPPGTDPTMASDTFSTELLLLHDRLKTELGPLYSDAWVDGGLLHIAVTDPSADTTVRDAGAVPVQAEYNAAELKQAQAQVRTWLAGNPVPGTEVHSVRASGRTGSIILRVPAEQVQALRAAAVEQAPAGSVPVIVEESEGMATPLSTK